MGKLNTADNFADANIIISPKIIRAKNTWDFLTSVFKIFFKVFSKGNRERSRVRKKIKIKRILNLYSANKLNIFCSSVRHEYYKVF